MSERTAVFILDRVSREYVSAELVDGVSAAEVDAAESVWRPVLDREIARMTKEGVPEHRLPQHANWSWREKHALSDGLLIYQMFGVEHAGQMQGLMLIQTANAFCRLPSQKDKGMVLVLFVATAPWNSHVVVPSPRYGQVGTVLIAAAIKISNDLGFDGRIGLHSLPQSEDWYARNMTDGGIDMRKSLRYFEVTPEQAELFVR